MRKKVVSAILCASMVAGMVVIPGVAVKADDKKLIGVTMPTKDLQRWNQDGENMKKELEAAGYEVDLQYASNDVSTQVSQLENQVANGCDLLVVASIDGSSLGEPLKQAKEKGIPVISYDRLLMNSDAVTYYATFDNYKVGQLQGQYIIDTLKLDGSKKKYNMEVTAGDPADNNATFFYNGAMDTLKKYIDDGTVKIVSKQQDFESVATPQWSTDEALNRMQNILSSYYADGKNQLDIALCSNDSTALGVTQAIESDYAGKNTPLITGQDGDVANLKNILDGKQAMTVYKAVANEAVVTLKLVKSVLDGNTPDESLTKEFDCECSYDTDSYDNGTGKIPSYLLTPEVITKDNYKEKLVDTGYYKEGSDGYLQAIE